MRERRFHLALAVRDFDASLRDYGARLGVGPCCVVDGTYALFRTEQVNLSISFQPNPSCALRHLGFEDPNAPQMTAERDVNGIEWERFTEEQQRAEILQRWPNARFSERG